MLNRAQEHFVDAVTNVALLLLAQDGPELPEKLSEKNIGDWFVVVISWIDREYF